MPVETSRRRVPAGEHRRSARLIDRRRAVGIQPKDLAVERCRVRRQAYIVSVVERRIELPVRSKSQGRVGLRGGADVVQEDDAIGERVGGFAEAREREGGDAGGRARGVNREYVMS